MELKAVVVKQVAVDSLIPYEHNTRTHTDAQVDKIAASIKEFGWTNPVLLNGLLGIIAGHRAAVGGKKARVN
jgi:ParB-like chromosome segregation protein Spo0J